MTPIPPVKLQIETDHSCNNWKCCFGCHCVKKNKKQDSPESVNTVTTIEKTTHVFETHRKHHTRN